LTLREKVLAAVRENPSLSNRQIAELVGCGRSVVQDYRKGEGLARESSENAPREKTEIIVDGNEATAESVSYDPKTLDEILAACKIDRNVWEVEKWVCNKWAQAGFPRATGKSKKWKRPSTEPIVTPLYQIKVWLKRIRPIASTPPVEPIVINFKASSKALPRRMRDSNLKRAIIVPDEQVGFMRDHRTGALEPFHDRRALDLLLQITQHVQPNRIVHLGDSLDLAEWSDKFVRSPEFYFCTQPALAEHSWWLARERAIGEEVEIDKIEGNHDARLRLAIINHNAAAYDLRPADDLDGPAALSMERLLGLASLRIKYHGPYPKGRVNLNSNLSLVHGEVVRAKSGGTVATVVNDLRHSQGQGHIHRNEMACKTFWDTGDRPHVYMAFSPGTVARIDPGIVPSKSDRNNWQQGAAEVTYATDGEDYFNYHPLVFHEGVTIYDGRRRDARPFQEITEQIQSDLKGVKIQ
jgi:hypothetical protein